jgi:hypothetical protein
MQRGPDSIRFLKLFVLFAVIRPRFGAEFDCQTALNLSGVLPLGRSKTSVADMNNGTPLSPWAPSIRQISQSYPKEGCYNGHRSKVRARSNRSSQLGVYSVSKKPGPTTDQPIVPPPERAAVALKSLKTKSRELQEVTSGLESELRRVESILRPLGLVSAWCPIASGEKDNGYWWAREIGYTVFGIDHRIALRTRAGSMNPDDEDTTTWRFAEAPHWMQIESVNKLPDLFEVLLERVEQTIKKMNAKKAETSAFVTALSDLLSADEA